MVYFLFPVFLFPCGIIVPYLGPMLLLLGLDRSLELKVLIPFFFPNRLLQIFEDVHLPEKPILEKALNDLNYIFAAIFAVEFILKLIGLGIVCYFSSFWNCLDSFIVVVSYKFLCCAVLCCAMPCCAVLYCAVLCCAVQCCAVPCRAVPCRAVPCRAVLCCAVLCCAVLCCAVLCRAVPCRAVSCHAVLGCPVLPCPALPCPAISSSVSFLGYSTSNFVEIKFNPTLITMNV